MQAETLFDLAPRARATDPQTSHDAAAAVQRGASELEAEIVGVVRMAPFPVTAFDIARMVQAWNRDRWDEGSIRTAVSRLAKRDRLVKCNSDGLSPRGHQCATFRLGVSVESVNTNRRT